MGRDSRNTYTYEQKLGAVREHLENGRTAAEAMRMHGVTSKSAFFRWCEVYRSQGAEALTPRRRGRPPKSRSKVDSAA